MELHKAAVLLAALNPLLPFWSFLSQSRWCHHGVALVSESSCNSPLTDRNELRDAYIGHRSLITVASPSHSIHALRKNNNSVTMLYPLFTRTITTKLHHNKEESALPCPRVTHCYVILKNAVLCMSERSCTPLSLVYS